jgi:hypothetical protein
MPFEAFVDWLCSDEGGDEGADRHWLSQHILLADGNGNPQCDFIGRIESFADDFREVADHIGLGHERLHRANVTRCSGEYQSYYTDRTADMIRKRYQVDIELFDYRF